MSCINACIKYILSVVFIVVLAILPLVTIITQIAVLTQWHSQVDEIGIGIWGGLLNLILWIVLSSSFKYERFKFILYVAVGLCGLALIIVYACDVSNGFTSELCGNNLKNYAFYDSKSNNRRTCNKRLVQVWILIVSGILMTIISAYGSYYMWLSLTDRSQYPISESAGTTNSPQLSPPATTVSCNNDTNNLVPQRPPTISANLNCSTTNSPSRTQPTTTAYPNNNVNNPLPQRPTTTSANFNCSTTNPTQPPKRLVFANLNVNSLQQLQSLTFVNLDERINNPVPPTNSINPQLQPYIHSGIQFYLLPISNPANTTPASTVPLSTISVNLDDGTGYATSTPTTSSVVPEASNC